VKRYDHDKSLVSVRCVRCRYIQPNHDGPCVICGHCLGAYLADFLYPTTGTATSE
jgi:hypothetical protein